MSVLTAIITHLGPAEVGKQLDYLRSLAPDSDFVLCHGGSRSDFAALPHDRAVYIEDPSLRGPAKFQSYNEILRRVYETYVQDEPGVDLVYFIEYDHLILSPRFEQELESLAERSDAGLFAKCVSPRNDTNCPHFARGRHDERLNRFFHEISQRDDPAVRWGCLGDGMLFRRETLAAVAGVSDPPHGFMELLIPSLVYHLGFEIIDVDAISHLYTGLRWRPEYTLEDALAAKRRGQTFLHPFKDLRGLDLLWDGSARRETAGVRW
ncbi:MAG TPA: hypothetical protein VF032_00240 [Thermoleophilaceae bacterium]